MKAFPTGALFNKDGLVVAGENGMDLRDYFAIKVLQAHLSIPETHTGIANDVYDRQDLLKACYIWADEMMEARKI